MNYSKEKNPFFEIDYSNKIVFFEGDTCPDIEDSSFRFIRLDNKTLAQKIKDTYGIERLPCILLYGQRIYFDDNYINKIDEIESAKEKILDEKIKEIIKSANIVLFMKGSVKSPYCRFSKGLVEMLEASGCDLDKIVYFDILMDKEMREKIKQYNQWPTYPQLFVSGKFIGGFDIVSELYKNDELEEVLNS